MADDKHKMNPEEFLKFFKRCKNKTYRNITRIINALSPTYKSSVSFPEFEQKLATLIVLLICVIEKELTTFYGIRMGFDRESKLKTLVGKEKERAKNIKEIIDLEAQWNPDILQWFKDVTEDGNK